MPKGWNATDPEKGMPHRHTRAKIRLLAGDLILGTDGEMLLAVLLKVAEKHPDTVLDALTSLTDPDDLSALDAPATVCLLHMQFVPCRNPVADECVWSADPPDVERVRRYQEGIE